MTRRARCGPGGQPATRAVADLIAVLLQQQAETVAALRQLDRASAPLTLAALQRERHELVVQLAVARRVLPWAHRAVLM
jgi:hypothetical protein